MRDHRGLHGKALDVLRFLAEKAGGDEDGEVRVLRPRVLLIITPYQSQGPPQNLHTASHNDFAVQGELEAVPDGHSPRLDDHAAFHWRRVHHVRVLDDVLIPLRVVRISGVDVEL
eukprot:6135078-Prorocentrum_lima.AAC.1